MKLPKSKPKRRRVASLPKKRPGAPTEMRCFPAPRILDDNTEKLLRAPIELNQLHKENEELKKQLQASRDLHLQSTLRNVQIVTGIQKLIQEASPDLRGVRLIDAAKLMECLA